MALTGGHRFAVLMADLFPFGAYAMGVVQAEDYDEKTGRRSPTKDKVSGELVWTVTVIDRDPAARDNQVKVKIASPYSPMLPGEIAPGSGLHPVEFHGLTATPYLVEGAAGRRTRLAFSFRAQEMTAQGKAPTRAPGSAPGRASGPAGPGGSSPSAQSGGPGPGSGEGKAA